MVWLRNLLLGLLVLLGALQAWLFWLPMRLDSLIPELAYWLHDQTGLHYRMEQLELRGGLAIALTGSGVMILADDQTTPLATAGEFHLRLALLDWLRGRSAMEILLTGLTVEVSRDRDGALWLFSSPLTIPWNGVLNGNGTGGGVRLFNRVQLQDSILHWTDGMPTGNPVVATWFFHRLEVTSGILGNLEGSGEGNLESRERVSPWQGTWRWLADQRQTAELSLAGFRPEDWLPYLGGIIPVDGLRAPVAGKVAVAWGGDRPLEATWKIELGAGELAWPKLFRWPFPLTGATATGSLRQQGVLWDLLVEQFEVHNSHGQAKGHLDLTGLGGDHPMLDLTAEAGGVPIDLAKHYYPVTIIPESVVQWLDGALSLGRVVQATCRIKGPVNRIPFPDPQVDGEWTFRIEGDVAGARVGFYPGLPAIEEANVHLIFDRIAMTALVQDGRLARTSHVRGSVHMENMVENPVVVIDAQGDGDLASLWHDVLAAPTLRWDEAVGMAGGSARGSGALAIKIQLPLDQPTATRYDGSLAIWDGWLKLPFLEQPLTSISGRLQADQDHLELHVAAAEFANAPMQGEMTVDHYRQPQRSRLQLHVASLLGPPQLRPWLETLTGPEGDLAGKANLRLDISKNPLVPGFKMETVLDVKDLKIKGRMGLEKSAGLPGEIRLRGQLKPNNRLHLDWLEVALGELVLLGSGEWEVSGNPEHMRQNAGFRLQLHSRIRESLLRRGLQPILGEGGYLHGDAPIRLDVNKLRGASSPTRVDVKVDGGPLELHGRLGWIKERGDPGGVTLGAILQPNGRWRFERNEVHLGNLAFALAGEWDFTGQSGKVNLQELHLAKQQGRLEVARNPGEPWSVKAEMKHFEPLALWQAEQEDKKYSNDRDGEGAVDWPQVQWRITADNLLLAHGERGSALEVHGELQEKQWRIKAMQFKLDRHVVRMNGNWQWLERVGSGPYQGNFLVFTEDLGGLLRGLDWHEGMESGQGEVKLTLDGNIPPGGKIAEHLTGSGRIIVHNGVIQRLPWLNDLLGLLSLPELPNLLAGNRPDLKSDGFYYKDLIGDFQLRKSVGRAERIELTGPSMQIVLSGSVDWPQDRMELLVGSRILQTLDRILHEVPVLGKLVEGKRKTLVEVQFDVEGPLANPRVRLRPIASLAPGIFKDILDVLDQIGEPPSTSTNPDTESSNGPPENGKKGPKLE